MKQLTLAIGFGAIAAVIAGCGGGSPEAPAGESAPAASAPAAPASEIGQQLDITLTSEPAPPRMGENTFEVMVMSDNQPVTDADVSVELFMPAMPSMKMAEMRNSIPLKHEGGGRYRGAGNVMMAGSWDATVSVKRSGQEIGSRKLEVTAN